MLTVAAVLSVTSVRVYCTQWLESLLLAVTPGWSLFCHDLLEAAGFPFDKLTLLESKELSLHQECRL